MGYPRSREPHFAIAKNLTPTIPHRQINLINLISILFSKFVPLGVYNVVISYATLREGVINSFPIFMYLVQNIYIHLNL